MPEPTYRIAQRLLASRAAVGVKQYGDDLTANSPGCMIIHALEEAADQVNYLLAEIQRRKHVIEKLEALAEEMRADKAPRWAFEMEKLSDLLGGPSALKQYDDILGGGTVAENATVAPRDERDALRAELAAAKEAIEDVERTLEMAEIPKYGSSGDRISWNERVELLSDDRDRLAADNARLRAALQPFADRIKAYPPWMWTAMIEREKQGIITGGFRVGVTHMPAMLLVQAEEALAATPTQSIAAHDAQLLREVAVKWYRSGPSNAAVLLEDEADRIEQEAQRG